MSEAALHTLDAPIETRVATQLDSHTLQGYLAHKQHPAPRTATGP